jgi:hypothetical protein
VGLEIAQRGLGRVGHEHRVRAQDRRKRRRRQRLAGARERLGADRCVDVLDGEPVHARDFA